MKIISWYESGRSENDQSENINYNKAILKLMGTRLNLFESLELALVAAVPPLSLLVANHPSREDMIKIGKYVKANPATQVIITRGSMSTLCETISEFDTILPSGLTRLLSYPQIGFINMYNLTDELEKVISSHS